MASRSPNVWLAFAAMTACNSILGIEKREPRPETVGGGGAETGSGGAGTGSGGAETATGPGSGGSPACNLGPGDKLVFVTSEIYTPGTGVFQSVEDADERCSQLADGNFAAWLSAVPSDATRLSMALGFGGPWKRCDGEPVAGDWGDLTDFSLQNPIDVDEKNVRHRSAPELVWTGTGSDGVGSFEHCNGWSGGVAMAGAGGAMGGPLGQLGDALATNQQWTDSLIGQCSEGHRLYCFEM